MSYSGYIDWHRLERTMPWMRSRAGMQTYVYAFWLVDYGRTTLDHGVTVLKPENHHPDWFLHAERADNVLGAFATPKALVSPNFDIVFHDVISAKPLLASVLLGTSDAAFCTAEGLHWWASPDCLTRRGKKLMKELDRLYERPGHIVTFIEGVSDENSGPRDTGG